MLHQVTSLSTASVSTIIIPGPKVGFIILANVGAAQVNLALDGGTVAPFTNTDPVTGATGLCTPLPAGQTLTLNGDRFVGIPIRAIMATGTTTLNIQTSAFDTSATLFPTN